MRTDRNGSVSAATLRERIDAAVAQAGGWLPFDRYMSLALYAPGLGYYARDARQFGAWPESGSDFVTAPEISPLFGRALARQLRQALQACGGDTLMEFGAGSGALAATLLDILEPDDVREYRIVDLSGTLRARQAERLARFGARVHWLDRWPDEPFDGVAIGNEVLDAMPVQLLYFDGTQWFERGVAVVGETLAWRDRPTALRPPHRAPYVPGTVTEIHPQAEAFVATLAQHLRCGAAFLVDYGFPAAEYYHPQRIGGTLVCHRAHRVDTDPLQDPGDKDITAHVNFSGIALAAQEAGAEVLGYTSQARFLVNCGLPEMMQSAAPRERAAAHKLVDEHEMGELFKVVGLARGCTFDAMGFAAGDRTHRL